MRDVDFAQELIDILDQSMSLIRQELVTLRNEVMQQKIEIATLTATLQSIKDDKTSRTGLLTVIVGGIIAAIASIAVALIQYFRG